LSATIAALKQVDKQQSHGAFFKKIVQLFHGDPCCGTIFILKVSGL
jgi:hypothetical protein